MELLTGEVVVSTVSVVDLSAVAVVDLSTVAVVDLSAVAVVDLSTVAVVDLSAVAVVDLSTVAVVDLSAVAVVNLSVVAVVVDLLPQVSLSYDTLMFRTAIKMSDTPIETDLDMLNIKLKLVSAFSVYVVYSPRHKLCIDLPIREDEDSL